MRDPQDIDLLQPYLLEYEKLKDEQSRRLGFRDNLVYLALGAFGAQFAFILGSSGNRTLWELLLVLPIINLALGWTYLRNDVKVSEIGDYISGHLIPCVRTLTNPDAPIFAWETFHRTSDLWRRHKLFQLLSDLLVFVVTGLAVLGVFALRSPLKSTLTYSIVIVEVVLLLGLAWHICVLFLTGLNRKV